MISKNQKHSLLRSLLSNSLPVLCKNGLGIPDVKFSVEALVGITVGEGDEVILVSIKETVTSDGVNVSHVWSGPHEDIPNSCDPNSGIKEEVNVSEDVHESEVCDLTEESEETNDVIEDGEGFNCQRSTVTNDIADYASSNWVVKQERTCSDMESFVKKEHQHYESTCGDVYTGEDETSKDDEEDYLFPPNCVTSQPVPHSRRRDNNCPRMTRGGRSRFMQRGRFRRFASSSNNGGCSSITSQNPSSLRDQRACDDLALTSGGAAYQDLMKEMCEQVVSQSMSMETQYVCHICQARRCSKSSLMDHIRGTHLAMDKYTCRECGERFRWFMQLHRHRKKFHPEPGDDQTMGDGDYATDEYGGGF